MCVCAWAFMRVLSMEKDGQEANGLNKKPLVCVDSPKGDDHVDDGDDFIESNSLLPPRRGGMSRNKEKVGRKVQWNDSNGNKLVEVLVFEPSDASDSDEDSDSCMCTIM